MTPGSPAAMPQRRQVWNRCFDWSGYADNPQLSGGMLPEEFTLPKDIGTAVNDGAKGVFQQIAWTGGYSGGGGAVGSTPYGPAAGYAAVNYSGWREPRI